MSEGLLGHGSIFQVENEDAPGTFIALSEVFSITPPGLSR